MSNVQLYHGDCLEIMPTLPAQSVQMVFADLPYGVTRRQWDIPICLRSFWARIKLTLSEKSSPILMTATQPFATTIINSQLNSFKYDLIWDKTRVTGFLNANRMPLRRHESVLVFYEKAPIYNPQKIAGTPWIKRRARCGDLNYDSVASNDHLQVSNGARYPTSILVVNSSNAKSIHPTQKPVALLEWLIKTYTNPGDTVLDPVAGSGTTAIAAMRTGRKSICIEKDATYFAAMSKRVADERTRMQQEEMAL